MSILVEEVKEWYSPLIGAFLLFSLTKGYTTSHQHGESPHLLYLLISYPILINENLNGSISKRRSGLASFVRSFEDDKTSDVLLNIQQQIQIAGKNFIESLDMAISFNLITWDIDSGIVYPNTMDLKIKRGLTPKPNIIKLSKKAEIFGEWLSQVDLSSVLSYLKVVL